MGALHQSESKKNAREEGALIVHEDEASFRQDPTLHQTCSARGCQPKIPSKGLRNTQKILGAVSLHEAKFCYRHQSEYFNAETWMSFLDEVLLPYYYRKNHRVHLIIDNASYHKKTEVYQWYKKNRSKLEVFFLPPYYPELNATEQIWKHAREEATHNRYFETATELTETLLEQFEHIQSNPSVILNRIKPFL